MPQIARDDGMPLMCGFKAIYQSRGTFTNGQYGEPIFVLKRIRRANGLGKVAPMYVEKIWELMSEGAKNQTKELHIQYSLHSLVNDAQNCCIVRTEFGDWPLSAS